MAKSTRMAQTNISTRSKAKKTLGKVDYHERAEFPHGVLPTKKDIIQNMLYLLRPQRAGQAQRSKDDASHLLAQLLHDHWIYCNIYTIHGKHIHKHIFALYKEFLSLCQTRKGRRNKRYFQNVEDFNKQADRLFDVFCRDEAVRNRHGLKMTDTEFKFLDDQRSDRKMFCEDFVDRKWITMDCRSNNLQSLEDRRQDAESEMNPNKDMTTSPESDESGSAVRDQDMDYKYLQTECYDDSNNPTCSTGRKPCVSSPHTVSIPQDDMPPQYRHVCDGVPKVKSEF